MSLGRKCANSCKKIIDILPNFKQYLKCVDEKKVKNPGTELFEMVKSSCRDNLWWCCKLLCAFITEICGNIGQGILCDWLEKSVNLVLEELPEPHFQLTVHTSRAVLDHPVDPLYVTV